MTSIHKLKAQARRHEQDEAWQEALDAYLKVVRAVDADGADLELGVHNRIGDILFRLGRQSEATKHYRMAADRYAEAGLLNNAIALCNKVMRQIPGQKELLLKIGRLSASQGFLTDARRAFLQYAEVKSDAGEMEAAFAALAEFAELAEDAEVREMLAERLVAHGDTDGAVEQLQGAYELRRAAGEAGAARVVRERIEALAPHAVPTEAPDEPAPSREPGPGTGPGTDAGGAVAMPDTPIDAGGAFDGAPSNVEPVDGLQVESAADAAGLAGPGSPTTGDASPPASAAGAQSDPPAPTDAETTADDPEPLPLLDADEPEDAGRHVVAPETDESGEEAPAEPLPLLDLDDPTDFGLDTDAGGAADADVDTGEEAAAESTAELDPDLGMRREPEPGPESGRGAAATTGGARNGASTDGSVPDDGPPTGEPIDPVADALDQARGLAAEGRTEAAVRLLDEVHRTLAGAGRLEDALRVADEAVALDADRLAAHQARVEYAHRLGDTTRQAGVCLELADALSRAGAARKASEVYRRVLDLDPSNARARAALNRHAQREPAASSSPSPRAGRDGSFVDLGALLEDEPDEKSSTRFVVPQAAPTGDEERDFADMLARFKTKVAEHVGEEDVASHYDLGLAFKEMGLLDEAISEFQTALRGGEDGDRLKVYEELGECFIQREQHNVAVKVLQRALELAPADEGEMVGIFYQLGRCYEVLGRRDEARDAYERVVGFDVEFRDVAERMARL